jgi:hypothetical protein
MLQKSVNCIKIQVNGAGVAPVDEPTATETEGDFHG